MFLNAFEISQKGRIQRRLTKYLLKTRALSQGEDIEPYLAFKLKNVVRPLERALKLLDEKKYGFCSQCDQKIPQKRLEEIPGAIHCLECQKKYEVEHADD